QRRARDQEEGNDLLRPVAAVCVVGKDLPVAVPDLDPQPEGGDIENDERNSCQCRQPFPADTSHLGSAVALCCAPVSTLVTRAFARSNITRSLATVAGVAIKIHFFISFLLLNVPSICGPVLGDELGRRGYV